jgi:hypothetical protein
MDNKEVEVNMKYHFVGRYVIVLIIVTVAVVALAGCDDDARVQVEYEQLANFYTYKLSSGSSSTTGAGDGMFILYKINRIANTGTGAKPYVFDNYKVIAITADQLSSGVPSGDNILLGSKLVTNLTVQPGQTKVNPGCIIKHALTSNPQALANTSALVNVTHQQSASQPVSMFRVPGDTTTAVIIGPALPATVQNLCGN